MAYCKINPTIDGYFPSYYYDNGTHGTTMDHHYNHVYDYFIPEEQISIIPLYNQYNYMQEKEYMPIDDLQKEMQDYFCLLNSQKGLKIKIEIPKIEINHVGVITDVYADYQKAGDMYPIYIYRAFDNYKNNYGDKTFKEFADIPLISNIKIILHQLDKTESKLDLDIISLKFLKIKSLSDNPNDFGELLK